MDTELNRKLVSEIEKRPVLYNLELKANRTQEDINYAWTEIATLVNRPDKFCKDRWMNLRSAYVKDLQKPQRTYYLRDDMDFLKQHVTSIKCKRLIWEDNSRTFQSKAAGTSHRTVEPEAFEGETVLFNLPYNTGTNDENPVAGPSGIRPNTSSDGSSCSHQTPPSDYRDFDEEILHIKSDISYMNVEPTDEYEPESASSRLDAESTCIAGRNSVQSPGKGRVASGKHTQEKGMPSKLSLGSRSQQFSLQDGIKSKGEEGFPIQGVLDSTGRDLPGPSHSRMADGDSEENGRTLAGRNSVPSSGKGRVSPLATIDLSQNTTSLRDKNKINGIKYEKEEDLPIPGPSHSRMADGDSEENGRTPRGSVTTPSTGIKRKKKITTKSKKIMPIDAKSRKSFMKSLGQEIRQMSDKQFRSFRSQVSIKIEKILNDDDRDSDDDSGSEYASASDSDDDSDVIPL